MELYLTGGLVVASSNLVAPTINKGFAGFRKPFFISELDKIRHYETSLEMLPDTMCKT